MAGSENRIRELRKEKGITQLRLSTELEVSQETVSAYERGKHFPSYQSLLRMLKLFDTSMDYLMGLSPIRRAVPEKGLLNDEVRLIAAYRMLTASQKERAYAYMQGMADDPN